ncbi:MAG: bifunctional serine/threonine-protein kinase/formylglycine-generating enzyme family protein, partial [Planctomycetia bacterium]
MGATTGTAAESLDAESLGVVEAFEEAWETGPPDIDAFLRRHSKRPLRLLLELVAIDLENLGRRGEAASVEAYLSRFPELAADASCVRELRDVVASIGPRRSSHPAVPAESHGESAVASESYAGSYPFLSPATEPGTLGDIAHYRVVRAIGRGAFGTVFEALDTKLNRRVAIKVLSPELATAPPSRKRFIREARAMASVPHENIVRVYAVEEEPMPYLVMEYVDGMTLQELMDTKHAFTATEVVHVGRQVAAALAAAHVRGLMHRDVKPGNVLLEQDGAQRVKLTDFGLARAVDDVGMTRTGTVVGTPLYMSPEQATGGDVDHRSDLFSLGAVLYAMVTGVAPFRAPSTLAVLRRVADDTPRPIAEISPKTPGWLADLVRRLLEKKPGDRIQSAGEVEELLAAAERIGIDRVPVLRTACRPRVVAVDRLWSWAFPIAVAFGIAVAVWLGGRLFGLAGRSAERAGVMPRENAMGTAQADADGFSAGSPQPGEESRRRAAPPPATVPFTANAARAQQQAWAEYLGRRIESTNSIGVVLVVIPPGRFMADERGMPLDVTLTRPLLLGRTEVTQAQWYEVMGTKPWQGEAHTVEGADIAASHVTWDDANAFCATLTGRERDAGAIGHDEEYRLPTEAEWEFACRAGTGSRYSFGESAELLGDHAWFGGGWNAD